jgi:hypothetical protein
MTACHRSAHAGDCRTPCRTVNPDPQRRHREIPQGVSRENPIDSCPELSLPRMRSVRRLSLGLLFAASALGAGCKKPAPRGLEPPAALAPAFALLDTAMSSAQKDSLSRHMPSDSSVVRPMLALWLENQEGPWNGLRVADSMRAHGVRVTDHMADVILEAYGAFRRGERVGIDSAVRLGRAADSAARR